MSASDTARLFIALWPDPATAAELARCRDAWQWHDRALPQDDDRLHLTLHFLGPVPRSRIAGLIARLPTLTEPFVLTLRHSALWRNGIALLAPAAPAPPPLAGLHDRLRAPIAALGLPLELRRFRPHVTLARRATGSTAPPTEPCIAWPIDRYALVESEPGGRYRVVAWVGTE